MDDSPGPAPKRGHALILATTEYQDSQLAALSLPGIDLPALKEVLDAPSIGHYEVTDLHNEHSQELKARLGTFFSSATPEETLLLYVSGHAVRDQDGEIYIAATDTRLDQLPWTGIDIGFIQKVASRSPCRRLLFILDTCFSGVFAAPPSAEDPALVIAVQDRFRESGGVILMTPSAEIQYALHGGSATTISEPDLLSQEITNGLSTGKADFQDDGHISAEEMFRYVLKDRRLEAHPADPRQQRRRPQLWSFQLEGELTVASNPMLHASALSKDLVELIDNVSFRARMLAVEDLSLLLRDESPSRARAARAALEHLKTDSNPQVAQLAASVLQKGVGPAPDAASAPGTSLVVTQGIQEDRPESPVMHHSGITTWLMRFFQSDLAIDLGMTNTVIYHCFDKKVVLDEPSMLTAERLGDSQWKILAVGADARSMLGRTPDAVEAVRPMKDGVIADFFFAKKMLRHFVTKVLGGRALKPSPRVLMCVPFSSTQVERHTFRECAGSTGARQVMLVSKSMAAAIGAGLPVSEARASVILYVGGAMSEVAVISLSHIVFASSVRVGGDHFDQAIINYARQKHDVQIGKATAEDIKVQIGAARRGEEHRSTTVKGLSASQATLHSAVLTSDDVADALQEPLQVLVNLLKEALQQTPPELLADAAEHGAVLAGGGALLRGLDKLLTEKTGLAVHLAPDPLTCVALGAGRIFEFMDKGHRHFDLE